MLKAIELFVQLVQAAAWPVTILVIFKVLIDRGVLQMLDNVLQRTAKLELLGAKLELRAAVLEADVKVLTSDLPAISKAESSTTATQATATASEDQQIEPWQKERMEYAETLALRQRAEAIDRMKNFYRQVILDTWRGIETAMGAVLVSHGIFTPENDHDGRKIIDSLEEKDLVPAFLIQLARRLWELKNEAFFSQVPVSMATANSFQNSAREFVRLMAAYKKQDAQ